MLPQLMSWASDNQPTRPRWYVFLGSTAQSYRACLVLSPYLLQYTWVLATQVYLDCSARTQSNTVERNTVMGSWPDVSTKR